VNEIDGLLQKAGRLDEDTEELVSIDEDFEEAAQSDEDWSPLTEERIRRHENMRIPIAILDTELIIRWRNQAFRDFRETEGLEYRGRPFYALFRTFTEKGEWESLMEELSNPSTGYCRQQRVEGRGPDGRSFIADLNILPLDYDADDRPTGYVALVNDVTGSIKSVIRANFDSILQASLLKDEDTGNHIARVNAYSRLIAANLTGDIRWIDVDEDFIEDIGILAAFHDVGKIGTPEGILLKAGKLNDTEWQVMREHPINGAMILNAHPNTMAKDIAKSHHERWDGSGYPFGLKGDDIPLSGQIVALADVYDALRSRRPYKEPFDERKTVDMIVEESGTHFDPELIKVFKSLRSEFDRVFTELKDEE